MFQAILKQQNLARVAFHSRVPDSFVLFPGRQPFGQLLAQFSAASRPAAKLIKQAHVVAKVVPRSTLKHTPVKNVKKSNASAIVNNPPKVQPNEKPGKEEATLTDPLAEIVKLNSTPGKYTGERHEGKAHGQGTLRWDEHNYYVGDFVAGNRTGSGVFHSKTVTYDGEWVNNKPQGQGTLRGPAGLTYTGTFVGGLYHGPGVYKRGDYEYTGSFSQGQRHGQGSAVSAYGAYEGAFRQGMRHGRGKLTRGNAKYSVGYEGDFANDVFCGQGEYTYTVHTTPDTITSTASGTDSLISSNLNEVTHTYKGEFSNGLKHGKGLYTSAEVTIDGDFSHDAPHGVCKVVHSSGATYTGALQRGAMHGHGVYKTASGDVYEGMYVQNVREGEGKVTNGDGSGHSGVFKNNMLVTLLSSTVRTPQGVYTGGLLTTSSKNTNNNTTNTATTSKPIMHGQGRLEGPHGVWEGEFNRGRLYNGSGVYTDKKGAVYEGVWHQGKWAGYGVSSKGKESKDTTPKLTTETAPLPPHSLHRNIVRVEKDGVVYEGEMHRGAWHGQGTITWPDGTKYTGSFVENRRSGYGELAHPDGSTLTGIFRNNCIHTGSGVYKHATHAEHGTWQDGVRVGHGKNVKSNGDVYEGTFVNGELVVSSMVKHSKGAVYRGECVDYVRHGQGELVYPDSSSTYVGSFAEGKRSGYGVHTSASGVYSGMYLLDQQHGPGQYLFANGDKYEGSFVRGLKHGHGVFTFAQGGVYDGEWRNGRQEGLGKHTNSDDTTYEGRFKGGGIVSGTRVYKDGAVYVGGFARARKHGEGKYTLADGSVYHGIFEYGVAASPGKVVYSSGEYTGEILHYKPHGAGVFVYNNGSVYEGSFEHGNREGTAVITHPDNTVLRGRFIFDKLYSGTGAVRNPDGSVFYGDVDNYMYSTGRLTYSDGSYCEGTFADNAIYNGAGSSVVRSDVGSDVGSEAGNVVFNGAWVEGRPVGTGTVRYSDGSVYTGDFTDGVRSGKGRLEGSDGSVYEGSFLNGAQTGTCTHTMMDSHGNSVVYSGGVLEGAYCGHGSLRTSEGVFEGSWEQGQLHGACTYTDKHGNVSSGEYVQGRREGCHATVYHTGYSVELTYRDDSVVQSDSVHVHDGAVYEGVLLNGSYHGSGTLTYPNGRQFVGEFKQGKPFSGTGTFLYGDGTVYSGSYRKGVKQGQGVFSYRGTVVYDGLWDNDKPVDV